jgi:hypothetical protein
MVAVIQSGHIVAVGQNDRLALRAALMMLCFNPDETCLLVPAEVVDSALCPNKARKP